MATAGFPHRPDMKTIISDAQTIHDFGIGFMDAAIRAWPEGQHIQVEFKYDLDEAVDHHAPAAQFTTDDDELAMECMRIIVKNIEPAYVIYGGESLMKLHGYLCTHFKLFLARRGSEVAQRMIDDHLTDREAMKADLSHDELRDRRDEWGV